MKTFFTADPHFGCENLRRNTRQEFATIEEHDAAILDGINRTVGRRDRLVLLGDFCLKRPTLYRPGIQCRHVFFILGNHDKEAQIKTAFGKNVWTTKYVKLGRGNVFCSHFPHAYWHSSHYGSYHAYGHLHDNRDHEDVMDQAFKHRRSMDVGVDSAKRILGEWRPFSEDEFFDHMRDCTGHGLVTRQ